jgi:hypothetical protein
MHCLKTHVEEGGSYKTMKSAQEMLDRINETLNETLQKP